MQERPGGCGGMELWAGVLPVGLAQPSRQSVVLTGVSREDTAEPSWAGAGQGSVETRI